METVYVNEADLPDVIPPGVQVEDGWAIWNAPRPLYGTVTWTGKFVRGSLYAAGPRSDADALLRNTELDAVELVFVTNQQVDEMIDQRLAEAGYTRADYADVGMGSAEIAAEYGLPWRA